MTNSREITITSTLDDNKQLSIKLENNFNDQDPSNQDLVKRFAGYTIDATQQIFSQTIPGAANKLMTDGQIWLISLGQEYLDNLESEKEKYNDDGLRSESVAFAQTFVGASIELITDATVAVFSKNLALDLTFGFLTQEAYNYKFFGNEKSAKDKLGDFVREIFPTKSAVPQLAIETIDEKDMSQTQLSIYEIEGIVNNRRYNNSFAENGYYTSYSKDDYTDDYHHGADDLPKTIPASIPQLSIKLPKILTSQNYPITTNSTYYDESNLQSSIQDSLNSTITNSNKNPFNSALPIEGFALATMAAAFTFKLVARKGTGRPR